MKIPIYQVDAFTSKIFKGNPAAVCPLNEWLPKEIMQKIAMENNLSETAFYLEDENIFHIRWFTPKSELDLAGHPTLATAHVILSEFKKNLKKIKFKTQINDTLNVTFENGLYIMDFPSRNPKQIDEFDLFNDALGKRPLDVLAHRDAVVILKDEQEIRSIYPDMEKLKKLKYPAVIITAPGDNVDFVSRNFAPTVGDT